LALATTGNGIDARGVPNANLNGCDVASNSSTNCTGGNGLHPGHVVAVGTADSTCGGIATPNAPATSDPYASRAANIPDSTCGGSYSSPQTIGTAGTTTNVTWTATQHVCGDLTINGT